MGTTGVLINNKMVENKIYTEENLKIGQQIIVGLSLPARQFSEQGNVSLGNNRDWRKATKLEDNWYTGEGLNGYVQLLGIEGSSIRLRCGAEGLEEKLITLNSQKDDCLIDLSKINLNLPLEKQPQQVIYLGIGDVVPNGVDIKYLTPTFNKKYDSDNNSELL